MHHPCRSSRVLSEAGIDLTPTAADEGITISTFGQRSGRHVDGIMSPVCGVSRFKVVRGRSSYVDLARRLTTRHVTRLHQIEVWEFDIRQT